MKILGLDIGDVRIGVAISDAIGMFASPYEVIDRKKTEPFKRILDIVKENNISKVIAGLPKSLNGEEKVQAEKVREFVLKLEKVLGMDIVFIDERYSTVAADKMLSATTKKDAKEKRKVVDKIAATYILQTYLDMKVK